MARSVSGSTLEPLLTSEEVAEILRISIRTLEGYAYRGTGPRVTRVGRHRRYRVEDLRTYIERSSA